MIVRTPALAAAFAAMIAAVFDGMMFLQAVTKDLMKDDGFRNAYPFLTIIQPVAFLTHVRTELAKDPGAT